MTDAQVNKPQAEPRSAYKVFRSIGTRWMDNDAYGHVNNVVYYSWFDTAVNAYLIEQGALDIHQGDTIGLVIETQCNYFSPLAFPQTVDVGIRVAKLGTSSVRYEVEWPGLSTEEMDAGYVLPCVAFATSDVVLQQEAARGT